MFGIEWLQFEFSVLPALYVISGIVVLFLVFRGVHKEAVEIDGITIKKLRYDTKRLKAAAVAALVSALVLPAIVVTPEGHRTVVWSAGQGVLDEARPPGVSLVIPYIQIPHKMDVRTQAYVNEEVYAQSSDVQEITVPLSVVYHVRPDSVVSLFSNVGMDYDVKLIERFTLQLAKQEIGKGVAEDFPRRRETIADAVANQLRQRLDPYGIVVEYVNIEDAVFDPAFINSIQDKVTSEVGIETADNERRQIEIQADAERYRRLTEASGEQQAIEQIAEALDMTATEYLTWLRLQVWDGQLPSTIVTTDSNSDDSSPIGLLFDAR
jgi:prohibitin 2